MICCPPARRRSRATHRPSWTEPGDPYRTVIGAGGAVRISSVKGSCVAAAVAGGCHDTTGWDAAMVTPPDIEARILRFYHAEKWTIGTIARQLHVHHSVVRRVLAQAGLPRIGPPPRKSRIDAYLPFIRQTLETFPTLTASRLYVNGVRTRLFGAAPITSAISSPAIGRVRKPKPICACARLPGEQGQVDWAHFGHLEIGRARRPLMAFVMVLSHSRQIFLRFFLDARMENFLRGHVAAFTAWHGCILVSCSTTI